MANDTLLYGAPAGGAKAKIDKKAASDFIAQLLHGVTMLHMDHLAVTGPGSFAKHEALNVYTELRDLADGLAEEVMGAYDIGMEFAQGQFALNGDPVADTQAIYDWVERHRAVLGAKSHIQNSVDGVLTALAQTLFKLRRLQ